MVGFDIVFENGKDDLVLHWDLIPSSISYRWLEKLQYVSQQLDIDNNRRFYSLPEVTQFEIYNDIIKAIHQLEDLGIAINDKIVDFESCDQHWLNHLHDVFANVHGRDYEEKSYLLSKELVAAWNLLHINIHRLEAKLAGNEERKRIVATWRNQGETMELFSIYDFEKFTVNSQFGDIFLNYRQVGKSPYEIFSYGDRLSLDVCVPSINWCADFKIQFYETDENDPRWQLPKFFEWYDSNFDFFSKNFMFFRRDKRVGLGAYPLAKLKTNLDNDTIIQILSHSKGIKQINFNKQKLNK